MSVTFEPFKIEHLRFLSPQASQRLDHAALMEPAYRDALTSGMALSAWRGSVCVAAAGCVPVTSKRAIAWALLSGDAGSCMLSIVRKSRSAIDLLPYQRIELTVRDGFEQGHSFARLLGMGLETPKPLRAYGPRGEDEYMYAKVK